MLFCISSLDIHLEQHLTALSLGLFCICQEDLAWLEFSLFPRSSQMYRYVREIPESVPYAISIYERKRPELSNNTYLWSFSLINQNGIRDRLEGWDQARITALDPWHPWQHRFEVLVSLSRVIVRHCWNLGCIWKIEMLPVLLLIVKHYLSQTTPDEVEYIYNFLFSLDQQHLLLLGNGEISYLLEYSQHMKSARLKGTGSR